MQKKLLGADTKVYMIIPDPLHPKASVRYAERLVENSGLGNILDSGTDEEKELINDLRPDGLHFGFPENILKEVASEIRGHGEFVPVTDKKRAPGATRFPNIPGFHNLQRTRLSRFTREAKKAGYEVGSGSTANPKMMEMMKEWGVDLVMPNVPDYLPNQNTSSEDAEGIYIPRPQHQNKNTKSLVEGDLKEELHAIRDRVRSPRRNYLKIATQVKSVGMPRQVFGV